MVDHTNPILIDRGTKYGGFDSVSVTSQHLKRIVRAGHSYGHLDHYQKESLDMICNKIARAVNGDPLYADNWVDIAGYAELVVDYLPNDDNSV